MTTTPTPSQLYGEFDIAEVARLGGLRRRTERLAKVGTMVSATVLMLGTIVAVWILGGVPWIGAVVLVGAFAWLTFSSAVWIQRALQGFPVRVATTDRQLLFYRTDGSVEKITWPELAKYYDLQAVPPDRGFPASYALFVQNGIRTNALTLVLRRPAAPVTYLTEEAYRGIVNAAGASGVVVGTWRMT